MEKIQHKDDGLIRVSVKEMSEFLNMSPRAIRFRIDRHELKGERDSNGRWIVLVDPTTHHMLRHNYAEILQKPAPAPLPPGNEDKDKDVLPRVSRGETVKEKSVLIKRVDKNITLEKPSGTSTQENKIHGNSKKASQLNLRGMAAFSILYKVFESVRTQGDEYKRLKNSVYQALRSVTCGYFHWSHKEKHQCYTEARGFIAEAILELMLFPLSSAKLTEELIKTLEVDAISSVVGLTRKFEKNG